ncbi:MAG: ribbon-helix-helix protein, CopG family, partial [Gammaproteobacteria bacterium]|nr:ribbon-helix-helix protein, CopG family [Gammaproteobacteria bacterium]
MRAISLRGVDEEIARKLKAEAAQRGTSVNALILQLIRAG